MNQYSRRLSKLEHVNTNIFPKCVDEWDETDTFCCKIPVGSGFHRQGDYYRCNYSGTKPFAHRLVFEAYNPDVELSSNGLEVSHLCGNGLCCNPTHLRGESRQTNIDRRSCIGYVVYPLEYHQARYLQVCAHQPPCMTAKFGIPADKPFA